MALQLPMPAPPGSSSRHVRAHRRWQAGQAHAVREQWLPAAQAFEQAATLHDDRAYALARAHALIKAGRPAEAVQCTQRIRRRVPDDGLAYTIESHALLGLGRPADAVTCLRELPAAAVRDADHHISLAVALQRGQRNEEAVRSFFDALALRIDDPLCHFRLGMSFKVLGMKAEAAECVKTAIVLGLGTSEMAARGQLAFLEREACRWPQASETMVALRAAVRALPADTAVETGVFPHAVLVDDPLEQRKVARHYALHVMNDYPPLPRRGARARGGRLRIGYLSADFHQHATSQLMAQMLECHDRAAFEVTLLSTGPDDGSPMRERIRGACEHFVDMRGHDFVAMAQHVRQLGIDILVDLKGATHDTLMPVLAQRPAPLQVAWLGFPGTTGAPFIDYFIGDRIVSPLEDAAHFSEQIAQMPLCYQPNDAARACPAPAARGEWGLPEHATVLCAFHQSYKISETVFDTWCGLLHVLPDAVLWLLQWNANVQAMLTAAAAARGIAADRLVFAPLLAPEQHLRRLASADLYLDAWPCNAHTTAGEALWVGVPVVTLRGRTFAQRVAASLLHAVGQDEWVADDTAGYVSRVLALARDPVRRRAVRGELEVQRRIGTLFDGAGFARDIEALFERMWERATAGLPPTHLAACSSAAPAGRYTGSDPVASERPQHPT